MTSSFMPHKSFSDAYSTDFGSFPFLPPPPPPPSGLSPPPPVEAVAAATGVHVFIH